MTFSLAGYTILARIDLLAPRVMVSIVGAVIGGRLDAYVPESALPVIIRFMLVALALKLVYDSASGLAE